MRKLFFLFVAALVMTSCNLLVKKPTKDDDNNTEESTTKKKKKKVLDDDDVTSDDKPKNKDHRIDQDDDHPTRKKDLVVDDNTNDTKNTNYTNTNTGQKTINWTQNKLQFKIPADLPINENSSTKFGAGDPNLFVTIYPLKGQMPEADLRTTLKNWAVNNNITYAGDVQRMNNLNGFTGVYIDGKAANGLPTSLLILTHPDDPSQNIEVWLQYRSNFENTAVEILKSFHPL